MEWPPASGEDGELFRDSDCVARLSCIQIDMVQRRWVAEIREVVVPNELYSSNLE